MDLTAELLGLEQELWDANLAGDGDFYARRLRDDAVAVSPWGTLDRDAAVAGITANRNPYTSYHLSDLVALPLGREGAVLTYKAEVKGPEVDHVVYATSAYAREETGWRAVFHQQTLPA